MLDDLSIADRAYVYIDLSIATKLCKLVYELLRFVIYSTILRERHENNL